eukprot:TRINITY_DN6367_c0_g2_i2.p1 TRINITY_DN6367_c0_g2~~TRINITY_DN6367_c0_g2_i2.p1  ORF type:complete len:298 (-),score=100.23 TRINITY_DN6367_c0_g2_i2:26-919(-)
MARKQIQVLLVFALVLVAFTQKQEKKDQKGQNKPFDIAGVFEKVPALKKVKMIAVVAQYVEFALELKQSFDNEVNRRLDPVDRNRFMRNGAKCLMEARGLLFTLIKLNFNVLIAKNPVLVALTVKGMIDSTRNTFKFCNDFRKSTGSNVVELSSCMQSNENYTSAEREIKSLFGRPRALMRALPNYLDTFKITFRECYAVRKLETLDPNATIEEEAEKFINGTNFENCTNVAAEELSTESDEGATIKFEDETNVASDEETTSSTEDVSIPEEEVKPTKRNILGWFRNIVGKNQNQTK